MSEIPQILLEIRGGCERIAAHVVAMHMSLGQSEEARKQFLHDYELARPVRLRAFIREEIP